MQAQSRGGYSSPRPMFTEQLESRTMLSVTITDGQMEVTGTDADDIIIIQLDADDSNLLVILDNDVPTFFDKRSLGLDVFAFFVDGLDGNDELRVDESNGRINLGFTFFG